ncbi:hypothetical protein SAMN04515674_10510 [Pseudarcicella hirudinis]|uniref:Arm DNA-binding domain-containing protein n=1 Tax=Pseudarcicella hirudinis TaxID=1079859 RepID=A0A1I5SFZ5_9BACT|nr:Arm DNA-binding domain-containing protein [Pseudarcicella hirudinis]SFP69678.1 hypothetical protein SAMN04515674_10510 [Pseudarcicella hirudinis]
MEISIALWNVPTKKKGFPIKIQIYKNPQNRKYIPTGFYTFKKDWDLNKQEPKPSHPQYINLLNYLYTKRLLITKSTAIYTVDHTIEYDKYSQ